jgi:hypothetical protein
MLTARHLTLSALAALTILSLAGDASAGRFSKITTRVSQETQFKRLCLPPQQWMEHLVPRTCKPGEQAPGGLFGNSCFDKVAVCDTPTIVR